MKKNVMIMMAAAALLLTACGTNTANSGSSIASATAGTVSSAASTAQTTESTGSKPAESKKDGTENAASNDDSQVKEHLSNLIDDYAKKIVDGVEFGWSSAVEYDMNQKIERDAGEQGKTDYFLVKKAPFTDAASGKEYLGKYLTGEELKKISDEMFDSAVPTFATADGKLYVAACKANKSAEFDTLLLDDMRLEDVSDNSLTAVLKEQIYDGETVLKFHCVKLGTTYDSWRIDKFERGEHTPVNN